MHRFLGPFKDTRGKVGDIIAKSNVPSVEKCGLLCGVRSNCIMFSFTAKSGKCKLYNDATTVSDSASDLYILDVSCFTTTTTTTVMSTLTSTPTTSPTTTACVEIRADIIFLLDTSGSTDECVDFGNVVGGFTSKLVEDFGDLISEDNIRIAAVQFAETGNILFDFLELGFDSQKIQKRLRAPSERGGGTKVNKGLKTIREDLFKAKGTGYRKKAAPVIIITVSDGLVNNLPKIEKELQDPYFDDVSFLMASITEIEKNDTSTDVDIGDVQFINEEIKDEIREAANKLLGKDGQ